ncbi:unnamed protein product [Lactuca saligna]|uniref:Uncharacterized protein n=1 Tax=Lactuca saligna TaxID=75948 RepID=A0AA35ZCF6_LACSI|nr:unnamed protein product [Lactuca saligna]
MVLVADGMDGISGVMYIDGSSLNWTIHMGHNGKESVGYGKKEEKVKKGSQKENSFGNTVNRFAERFYSYLEKVSRVAECCLCGGNTGVFRKSTDGQWVHAFCAEAETQKHGVEEWNSLKKVRVAAKILQDAAHGKNYKSYQDSGARRLCDAIVLGGIKDNEKAMVLKFGGQALGWNLKDEYLPPGWICLVCGAHDNQQELPHNFKKMAKDVYTPDVMEASDRILGRDICGKGTWKIGCGWRNCRLLRKPFLQILGGTKHPNNRQTRGASLPWSTELGNHKQAWHCLDREIRADPEDVSLRHPRALI